MALYFRKYIIRRDKFDWEMEEDDEEESAELEYSEEESGEAKDDDSEIKTKRPGNISHTGQF